MILERWGGEARLEVKTDRIQIDGGFDLDVYSKKPDERFELGSEQLDIFLTGRPRSKYIVFPFEAPNLDVFLQPPLTAQEIAEGAFRPTDIVNSLAIYYRYGWGNKYKTGKVAHALRPLLIADDGKKQWADWFVKDKLIGIDLSKPEVQKFLDTAKYRVLVDPTFGKTDQGGSCSKFDSWWAFKGILSAAGTITKLHVYICEYNSGDKLNIGIYDDNSDYPKDLQVGTPDGGFDPGGTGDIEYDCTDTPLSAGTYWFATGYINQATDPKVAYDSSGGNHVREDDNSYPTALPSSFSGGGDTGNYVATIYATYTAAGAGQQILTLRREMEY